MISSHQFFQVSTLGKVKTLADQHNAACRFQEYDASDEDGMH
jgi:hypothetical protein